MQSAPSDLEARAERAVRRGELLVALELFETLLRDRPEDDRLRNRMDSVRALLQPSEMVGRRRAEPDEGEAASALESLSDAEQAELHASSGRFEEAVACYERALAKAPRNELLRERYEELKQLSPPSSRALDDGLLAAEKLDPHTPAAGLARVKPPEPEPKPAAAQPGELPRDAVAMLRALLDRVRGGRRRPPASA